jgi:hypothetical protein
MIAIKVPSHKGNSIIIAKGEVHQPEIVAFRSHVRDLGVVLARCQQGREYRFIRYKNRA